MRRELPLILVLVAIAGCHTYAPVTVHVYDASTMKPLKGITVASSSMHMLDFFHPKNDRGVTNDQGDVVLQVCTDRSRPIASLQFLRDGYLLDDPMPKGYIDLPVAHLRKARREPYRVDLALLPMDEYRRRYP